MVSSAFLSLLAFLEMFRLFCAFKGCLMSHSGRVAGMPLAGCTKAYLDFCKIGFSLSLLIANLALVRVEIIYNFKTH